MKRLLIITLINAFALLLTSCEKEDELVLDENLIEQEAIGDDDTEEIEHIKKIMKFVKSKSNKSSNEVPPACPKGGSPDSNGHCDDGGDPDDVNDLEDSELKPDEVPNDFPPLIP